MRGCTQTESVGYLIFAKMYKLINFLARKRETTAKIPIINVLRCVWYLCTTYYYTVVHVHNIATHTQTKNNKDLGKGTRGK